MAAQCRDDGHRDRLIRLLLIFSDKKHFLKRIWREDQRLSRQRSSIEASTVSRTKRKGAVTSGRWCLRGAADGFFLRYWTKEIQKYIALIFQEAWLNVVNTLLVGFITVFGYLQYPRKLSFFTILGIDLRIIL